ncbi:MAG: sodium/proline symporter [Planctomycetota bacterium]|nr:sodium/proline symporter [Planctomycetota bacterium]MDA1221184.1 sodium/proline symporter [Planctomycetota bacterium]
MERTSVILVTLVAYKVVLLAIGFVAERRTRDESDFLLGGRRLGPLVTAISASASSSSVWTLLGVSGYAYQRGLSALWLFPACVGGFAINWFLVAPRLRRRSAETAACTVTELLAGPGRGAAFRTPRVVASVILIFCLTTYVASQFQGAGKSFQTTFGLDSLTSILVGSLIVVVYTVLGGFWAVSLTDTLQGLWMAATAVALPVAALIAVGGPSGLAAGVGAVPSDGYADLLGGADLGTGALAVLALFGIGLGYPGQPHVVNRFMAVRGDAELRRARIYAMSWAVAVYAGMIVLGLCGRVLHETAMPDSEQAFFALADQLFPAVVSGVMVAAVLSAIMSTADSQLLVAASAVSHDLGWKGPDAAGTLLRSRVVVLLVSALAVGLALTADDTIFGSVLFAWSALGAAFGPLLLVTLWRGPVHATATTAAMALGAGYSVVAYLDPAWKGGVHERVLPFVAASAVAWLGSSPTARS